MVRLSVVAFAALIVSSPVLAGPAGDTLRTALYAGTLSDGLSKLEPMAASGDTEAAFGVGTLKLATAIEQFTRTLYRHGFDLPDGRPAGIERGDLLIARDPLGVKPLYHATTAEGFLFASELKALIQCDALPRRIDPVALHYHLAYLWTPAPRTLLDGVEKLLAWVRENRGLFA